MRGKDFCTENTDRIIEDGEETSERSIDIRLQAFSLNSNLNCEPVVAFLFISNISRHNLKPSLEFYASYNL